MRKKFTFSLLLSIVIFYTYINNVNNVANNKSWGSCNGCHTSSSNTVVDSLILIHPTTGAVMSGFYPDSTYRIRMVGSHASGVTSFPRFGFQLRAINGSSSIVGTFQTPVPTNTGLSTGTQMLTNSAAVVPTNGKYVVEALWKAPTGQSNISLQSIINAVDTNNQSTGDAVSAVKSESFNVLGVITSLNCTNARIIGNITSGSTVSGVSFKVPYTGGNAGPHNGQIVNSTTVNGLTATLASGNFANGNDSLTYIVSGTASNAGNASFSLNIGLRTCNITLPVTAPVGVITSLNCLGGRNTGILINGQAASGASFKVPYTGGNTGTHSGQVVTSTGVSGLTATLSAGNFALGNDSLTYTITGTPTSVGTANFALNIGGRSCTYSINVNPVAASFTSMNCANGRLKASLMNGTPTVSTDSFKIPIAGGNGGVHSGQIVNSTGVTGLTATLQPGAIKVGNDSLIYAISGTPNGTGDAIFAINVAGKNCNFIANVAPPIGVVSALDCLNGTYVGTVSSGNPASGVTITIPYLGGNAGTYPKDSINSNVVTGLHAKIQPGILANGSGSLTYQIFGTPTTPGNAEFAISLGSQMCLFTLPVDSGSIAAIDCNSGTTSGTAVAGAAASGLSFSIPYSGGNGLSHGGQTMISSNTTGLTASLSPGSFSNGAGSLTYNVTGTPNKVGTASFAVNIGGKNCTYNMTVIGGLLGNINCGAGVTTGTLMAASPASGVSFSLPYTGSNGGIHNGQIVNSTGITGLTAKLDTGIFTLGSGTLIYNITGTPSTFGTADFLINVGGRTCIYSVSVIPAVGTVTTLNCANGTTIGSLTATEAASGVSFTIPYTGGNNGTHSGQIITSDTVSGLTATTPSALFNNGNGTLTFTVSGTPAQAGKAYFAINLGGKTCNYFLPVKVQKGLVSTVECGQILTNGSLTAEAAASGVSFKVPYTGGNGGIDTQIVVQSTGVRNLTARKVLDTLAVGNDSLTFVITGTPDSLGIASFSFTAYGNTCVHTIPVARPNSKASIKCSNTGQGTIVRGDTLMAHIIKVAYGPSNRGFYLPDTIKSTGVLGLTAIRTGDTMVRNGDTIRYIVSGRPSSVGTANLNVVKGFLNSCTYTFNVIHPVAMVDSIPCDSIKLTQIEPLMEKRPALGVSLSVPYLNGNGGTYSSINITSTGVEGLSTSVSGGLLSMGNGSINLPITGTPTSSGGANFMISIGGKTCNYSIPVAPFFVGTVSSVECDAPRITGALVQGKAASGDSIIINYNGGNRGYHLGQTVNSTGVTGLTATLSSGQFAIGFGQLAYVISGTPSSEGIAKFALNIGGQQCVVSVTVRSSVGEVLNIGCTDGVTSASIFTGSLGSGIFFTIPYQGGNGGVVAPQNLSSTGVTGLNAQLTGGFLNFGDGTLKYNLSGTTTSPGWAVFNIQIGNQQCNYSVKVIGNGSSIIDTDDKLMVYKSGSTIRVVNHRVKLNYTILDLAGKALKQSELGIHEETINLTSLDLASGVYFIVLKGESTSHNLKFSME